VLVNLHILIEDEIDAALIPLDDFFSADIPDSQWDQFTVEQKLRNVFDCGCVLMPLSLFSREVLGGMRLILNQSVRMEPMKWTANETSTVILIEGAYSASPKHDLVDLASRCASAGTACTV